MPSFRTPRHLWPLLAVVGLLALARPASAQYVRGTRSVSLVAGPVQFDMSGTGTTSFGALRTDQQFFSWLVLEQGLGVMRPNEDGTTDATYLVPELQVQGQLGSGQVRPYLGTGIGFLIPLEGNGHRTKGVASGALGARTTLSPTLDLRTEMRITALGATLVQYTIGLARRF